MAQEDAVAVAEFEAPSKRGEVTYSMSYVVVEDSARFKMRLAASEESMTYSILIRPQPRR